MANQRGIRINQQSQVTTTAGVVDGFRLVMALTDGYLMPNEIFLYEPLPAGVQGYAPASGPQGPQDTATAGLASFVCVCSPADLAEYPAFAPAPGQVPPYFRLSHVDLLFRSKAEAMQAASDLQKDIARLVRSMNVNDQLSPPATYWVGDVPPSGTDIVISPSA
jgi:hypothetical protein